MYAYWSAYIATFANKLLIKQPRFCARHIFMEACSHCEFHAILLFEYKYENRYATTYIRIITLDFCTIVATIIIHINELFSPNFRICENKRFHYLIQTLLNNKWHLLNKTYLGMYTSLPLCRGISRQNIRVISCLFVCHLGDHFIFLWH